MTLPAPGKPYSAPSPAAERSAMFAKMVMHQLANGVDF
jgi:hypothetical protein